MLARRAGRYYADDAGGITAVLVLLAILVTTLLLFLHKGIGFLAGFSFLGLLLMLASVWLRPGSAQVPRHFYLFIAGVALLIVGLTWFRSEQWQAYQLPETCERQPVTVSGRVEGLVEHQSLNGQSLYRVGFDVDNLEPKLCATPRRLQLFLPPRTEEEHSWLEGVQSGAQLEIAARLRRPWGRVNPFALEGEAQALIRDIHAQGSGRLLEAPRADTRSLSLAAVDRLRQRLSGWLEAHASLGMSRFLRALAVADRRGMTAQDWEVLRQFGLTHLWVISGMHISLVALPGWYLGSMLTRSLGMLCSESRAIAVIPVLGALLPAFMYSALAGFSLPTKRALLMLTITLLWVILRRPLAPFRVWLLIAIVLLASDPFSLLGPSVWLSLGAVALILWCHSWRKPRGFGVAFLRIQAFLVLAMMPLSLYWFHGASAFGALANLIAIPLISFLVLPCLLAALLLQVFSDSWAQGVLAVAEFPLAVFWGLLERAQTLAPSVQSLQMGRSPFSLLGLLIAMLGAALPGFPGKKRIIILLLLPTLISIPSGEEEFLRLRIYDVGQGTAVLIDQGKDRLLYDTGPASPGREPVAKRALLPSFRREDIDKLDLLVISHPDSDHDGGEKVVLRQAEPTLVLRGRRSIDAAPQRRDSLCRLGSAHRLNEIVTVHVLSQALDRENDNNSSCVLLVTAYGRRILLPGDIDVQKERDLVGYWGKVLKADILLAGHHGSGTSSSRLWLREVDADFVIVSAGRANRFGHPAPAVVRSVDDQGGVLLNTAFRGAIEFHIYPDGRLHCRSYRHSMAPFWRRGPFHEDCGRRVSGV